MVMRVLALLALVIALPVLAQQDVEIIPLRHQTLDRVLPALQPVLEPGGTLSGMNDQLLLRASPRNRQEIRRALAAIDIPLRRLVIHVSQSRGLEGSGRGGQVWDTRSARRESGGQMVQTVDGGRALIQV